MIGELGTPRVIYGEGLGKCDSDAYTAQHGGLGITFETGCKDDINIEEVLNKIINAIKRLGIIDDKIESTKTAIKTDEFELLDAYHNVIATPGFKFTKDWQNFEIIEVGEVYAEDENGKIVATKRSQIIFAKPKDKIVIGQQAAMLLTAKH